MILSDEKERVLAEVFPISHEERRKRLDFTEEKPRGKVTSVFQSIEKWHVRGRRRSSREREKKTEKDDEEGEQKKKKREGRRRGHPFAGRRSQAMESHLERTLKRMAAEEVKKKLASGRGTSGYPTPFSLAQVSACMEGAVPIYDT